MREIREQAIVLGAGMGGLLAARVLSEFYETVTVVERDRLPDASAQRRGVPQGRHFHVLLSGGSQVLGQLFPGLLEELAAAGATVCDEGDLSRVCIRFGRHEFNRSAKFADTGSVVLYLASRPFLESHVRRRVHAIDNVRFLEGHEVVELVAEQAHHVTGVRVANRETGADIVLDGDLIVDAMGRGARTPAFLHNRGHQRPLEQRVEHAAPAKVTYSSQLLRMPPGLLNEKLIVLIPGPERLTGGSFSAYEDGTCMLTVGGLAGGHEPPANLAGMIDFAAQFAPAELVAALHAAEPLGEVSVFRYPGAVWRRYDKMRRFPEGLLVFGDAICSFNPIYGQGMTVAAFEAVALRDCLAQADADLSRRFFRATAKRIVRIWRMNELNDLYWSQYLSAADSQRRVLMRLANWRVDRAMTAAANDTVLTEQLVRVWYLVDSPTRLLRPASLIRMLASGRWHKASKRASGSNICSPATVSSTRPATRPPRHRQC